MSLILLLAPLAPVVFMMLGLYYLFRYYLNAEFANAIPLVITLAVAILITFLITVVVNLLAIKKYVTTPITTLVDRVSKFRHLLDPPEFQEEKQSSGDGLDDIQRSVEDFRTIEGMANRIRHLETEISKIYYDPLTGLYNRRYLDENFARVTYTLSRSNGVLSVLMVDIDHFKSYNDLYGHLQGDECLKLITAIINESIDRTDDFAVRYGGDEFAVVLPNTDKTGAIHIAETILDNVRAKKIFQDNNPVTDYVSVSIGVTSGKIKHTHIAEDFFERADEMLYKSKQSGRDMYSYSDLV